MHQNCHILQIADVYLTQSLNQGNLISLFRVCTFSGSPLKYFIFAWQSNLYLPTLAHYAFSRIMRESHACGSKIVISRIQTNSALFTDSAIA